MLGSLMPPVTCERLRALVAGRPRRPAGEPPFRVDLTSGPASMRPLHPAAAINDNPLGAIEAEVERELRAGGYLR